MNVCCLLNNSISPAVRYALEFILNSRGFFFNWESKPQPSGVLITYGDDQNLKQENTHHIHIPCIYNLDTLHQSTLTWQEIKIDGTAVPVLGLQKTDREIPFDLAATVYYHLTRIDEKSCKYPEEIDRNLTKQRLYKFGRFKIPVVDVLCRWFAEIIDKKEIPLLKKALFPQGQSCGVAVTHDIDRLHAINPLKKRLFKLIHRFGPTNKNRYEMITRAEKRLWIFDKLVSDYQKRDIKATFFFLAKKMENKSYRYDIRIKKIRSLLHMLCENKQEIALHSSRYAFDRKKRYHKEKRALDKALGSNVAGLRQHYIRCLFPEIWRIASGLNLLYDSSLVFRRMSGFRAGTSHPFSGFNYENGAKLPIIECPALFFENTLPGEGADQEKAVTEIKDLFEQVKKYQGVMVALWHQDNIYENNPLPKIWKNFLDLLDSNTMYLETLQKQVEWNRVRNKIKVKGVVQEGEKWSVILDIPENLSKFTLILPAGFGRVTLGNAKVCGTLMGNNLIIETIDEVRELKIKFEQNL
jgi:hypothetical protein